MQHSKVLFHSMQTDMPKGLDVRAASLERAAALCTCMFCPALIWYSCKSAPAHLLRKPKGGGAGAAPGEEDSKLLVVGRAPALRFGLGGREAAPAPLADTRLQVSLHRVGRCLAGAAAGRELLHRNMLCFVARLLTYIILQAPVRFCQVAPYK